MASESLYVPEDHLKEVIAIIRAGLAYHRSKPMPERIELLEVTIVALDDWCRDEEEYLSAAEAD